MVDESQEIEIEIGMEMEMEKEQANVVEQEEASPEANLEANSTENSSESEENEAYEDEDMKALSPGAPDSEEPDESLREEPLPANKLSLLQFANASDNELKKISESQWVRDLGLDNPRKILEESRRKVKSSLAFGKSRESKGDLEEMWLVGQCREVLDAVTLEDSLSKVLMPGLGRGLEYGQWLEILGRSFWSDLHWRHNQFD